METVDLTNITELISYLNDLLDKGKSKAPKIPSPLILLGGENKSGLSVREITKEIITKSQKYGVPIGPLADGTESVMEKMVHTIVETIVEHIIKNAKVTVVIPAGIPVTTAGTALGVPVVTQGSTVNYATGIGVIQ
jgi:hypothetical protein